MATRASTGPRHCPGCGSASCTGCLPELDPPRYCTTCGSWMATRVQPRTVVSTCRRCATVS